LDEPEKHLEFLLRSVTFLALSSHTKPLSEQLSMYPTPDNSSINSLHSAYWSSG